MKKVVAVATLVFCGMSSAMAASNTITFDGQVIDAGCDISVDGGAADGKVQLGSTVKADLASVGATGAPKSFSIDLTNCPTDSTGNITFSGTLDADGNASHFENTSTDTTPATGVAVELTETSSSTNVENDVPGSDIDLSSGSATVDYFAQLIATTDTVTSGAVESVLTYNIAYN